MPTDRLLVTLLRTLQTHSEQQDTPRILGTAASLFTTLSNPLNLTLLTAQLLTAPAIWTRPEGLRTCLRFMQVWQSAAISILKYEDEVMEYERKSQPPPSTAPLGGNLSRHEWVKSVLSGADSRSPQWRHILVISGLLIGFEAQDRGGLSRSLRDTLSRALVKTTNLVIQQPLTKDELAANALVLALNYSFELLSGSHRAQLDYDRLLPILMGSAFFSPSESYKSGYLFASVDPDIEQISAERFSWSERSRSFNQLSILSQQPLMVSMGPLARLIAHSVEHCHDSWIIEPLMDDLVRFANTIASQWRRCKLSEIDGSEEATFLTEETTSKTLPLLHGILRTALFAVVIILRAILSRVLNDGRLATPTIAPLLASNSLHVLRHFYFLTTRVGGATFSMHTFVHLTSIDILAAYPEKATAFLHSIRPTAAPNSIPSAPIDRNLDLFFLNTAEHFSFVLDSRANEDLLIGAATPYLEAGGNNALISIFEAAHSVMLSVLSASVGSAATQMASIPTINSQTSIASESLTTRYMPFYVDALFRAFPRNLSSRQFRLAFRTLLGISTVPTAPDGIADTLMELLHHRIQNTPSLAGTEDPTAGSDDTEKEGGGERCIMTLALIDSLPALPPTLLQTWLPLIADLIPSSGGESDREKCARRFWTVLSDGELDAERSLTAVRWWCSQGGREMLVGGNISKRARSDGLFILVESKL